MITNTHLIIVNITNNLTVFENTFKLVISNSAFNFLRQCVPSSNTNIRENKSAYISAARKITEIIVK